MKRLLLFALLVLLLTSCGKPAARKIGVMWYTKSVMAEQVYAAFEKRLQELAPEVDIELQAGIPDIETATSVYQRFAAEKDGVVVHALAGGALSGDAPHRQARIHRRRQRPGRSRRA